MMYFVHNSQGWCQHITWQVLYTCEQQIGIVKLITHFGTTLSIALITFLILEFHILLSVGYDLLAQTKNMFNDFPFI